MDYELKLEYFFGDKQPAIYGCYTDDDDLDDVIDIDEAFQGLLKGLLTRYAELAHEHFGDQTCDDESVDYEITLSYDIDDETADSSGYCDDDDFDDVIDADETFDELIKGLETRYAEIAYEYYGAQTCDED